MSAKDDIKKIPLKVDDAAAKTAAPAVAGKDKDKDEKLDLVSAVCEFCQVICVLVRRCCCAAVSLCMCVCVVDGWW